MQRLFFGSALRPIPHVYCTCFECHAKQKRTSLHTMNAQSQTPPPHIGMLQLLNGAHVAGSVSCLAQLGIPDLVEDGPKSAELLATQTGTNSQALYRLLRATASVG